MEKEPFNNAFKKLATFKVDPESEKREQDRRLKEHEEYRKKENEKKLSRLKEDLKNITDVLQHNRPFLFDTLWTEHTGQFEVDQKWDTYDSHEICIDHREYYKGILDGENLIISKNLNETDDNGKPLYGLFLVVHGKFKNAEEMKPDVQGQLMSIKNNILEKINEIESSKSK